MTSPERAAVGLWLALATGTAAGQDGAEPAPGGLVRALEMPAHEALVARMSRPGTELAAFASDGCSGGLSSAWEAVADMVPAFADLFDEAPPWQACCVTHDRAYHDAGGATEARASHAARLAAAHALRDCVIATGTAGRDEWVARLGQPAERIDAAFSLAAGAMFRAVRLGGGPCSGLPWRWGFGYPDCAFWDGE